LEDKTMTSTIAELRSKYEFAYGAALNDERLSFEDWLMKKLDAADQALQQAAVLDVENLRRLLPLTFCWVPPSAEIHLPMARALAYPTLFGACELHPILSEALRWIPEEAPIRPALVEALTPRSQKPGVRAAD
jgi:hypothetical protein